MATATSQQRVNFLFTHGIHVNILKNLDDGDHRTNQYAGLQDEQAGHFPANRLYIRFGRKVLQLTLYPPDSCSDRISGHGCSFSTILSTSTVTSFSFDAYMILCLDSDGKEQRIQTETLPTGRFVENPWACGIGNPTMNTSNAQREVAGFVEAHGMDMSPESRLLDLVSEVGETAKALLKETDYGRTEFQPGPEWADELGDTLFALICLANATGVDLEKALDQVLEKYRDRLNATGDPGSGR